MKTENLILSKRNDGFGQRLWSIINGMALASLTNRNFYFSWPKIGSTGAEFHAVLTANETFSHDFLEKHHTDLTKTDGMSLKSLTKNSIYTFDDLYSVPSLIAEPEPLNKYFPRLKIEPSIFRRAYDEIVFSEDIECARKIAEQISLPDGHIAAIHIRAGDIVYGPFRFMERFATKALPFFILKMLVEKLQKENTSIFLFGEDNELMKEISTQWNVKIASNLYADYQTLNSTQKAVFDITLMSRFQSIYAGSSGFSSVAAAISGGKSIDPHSVFNKNEMVDEFLDLSREFSYQIPELQKSFFNWYAFLYLRSEMDKNSAKTAILNACRLDKDNYYYKYVCASYLYSLGEIEQAKDLIFQGNTNNERGSLVDIMSYRHGDGKASTENYAKEFFSSEFDDDPLAIFFRVFFLTHHGDLEDAKKTYMSNKEKILSEPRLIPFVTLVQEIIKAKSI